MSNKAEVFFLLNNRKLNLSEWKKIQEKFYKIFTFLADMSTKEGQPFSIYARYFGEKNINCLEYSKMQEYGKKL